MNIPSDPIAEFHRLHSSGCFVMPNPWDVGSARALEQMGFKALATTSAGMAWTLGRADNQVTLDQALEHLRLVAAAVTVPVNADFEGGFAVDPADVAREREAGREHRDRRAVDRGLVGRRGRSALRVRAGRGARQRRATGDRRERHGRSSSPAGPRGSCVGRPDIDETIRRLRAYADAGADCLYAPRIDKIEHVAAIVAAVSPKPVNLLINAPFTTVAEAAQLGVRRISVGGTLARTAWGGFLEAAQEIADAGTFTRFDDLPNVEALMSR